jgi:hypothetical protein
MGGIMMMDMGMDIMIGLKMRRKADMVGTVGMEVSIRETWTWCNREVVESWCMYG